MKLLYVEVQVHRSTVSEVHHKLSSEALVIVDSPVETRKQVDLTLFAVVTPLNEGMNNNSLLAKLISAIEPKSSPTDNESSTDTQKRADTSDQNSDTPAPKRAKLGNITNKNLETELELEKLK